MQKILHLAFQLKVSVVEKDAEMRQMSNTSVSALLLPIRIRYLRITLRITVFLYFAHRQVFQNTKERSFSETGSVSILT
jgi:hypothetical protein